MLNGSPQTFGQSGQKEVKTNNVCWQVMWQGRRVDLQSDAALRMLMGENGLCAEWGPAKGCLVVFDFLL